MSSRMDNGTNDAMGNASQQVVPDVSNNTPGRVRKRVRGPTCMRKIWGQPESDRIGVMFNEYGQPVDKETSKLTHFMGSLARSGKWCPVHKPWHKVDKEKKQVLLEFLKSKFDLPPGSDDWILKSFGKKVRNWRARIKKDYYDPSSSFQQQIDSKPNQVHPRQWVRLLKSWNKRKTKRLSDKNKVNRAKKVMVLVTGKKSYARVREELKEALGVDPNRMQMFVSCFSKDGTTKNMEATNAIEQMRELSSQLPEGSTDEPGPEDVFSQVMGKDRNGDAQMFGLGVRSSDVWGVIPSRSACRRENMKWRSTCEQLSNRVDQLTSMVSKLQGISASDDSSIPFTTQPRQIIANEPQSLTVGAEVYLRSILNSTENVAKGWIRSLNPTEVVGGEEIGPNWCEVNVQVAIKRDERLVRPYEFIITVEDAVGATITWPCPFISVVPQD